MINENGEVLPELVPTEADVERYARAICWAWTMDPDAEDSEEYDFVERTGLLGWLLPGAVKRKRIRNLQRDDVQKCAWAWAACAKADADQAARDAAWDRDLQQESYSNSAGTSVRLLHRPTGLSVVGDSRDGPLRWRELRAELKRMVEAAP